jgi:hypothetical protein
MYSEGEERRGRAAIGTSWTWCGRLSLRDWVTWVGGELGEFGSKAEVAMANWYNDGQIRAAEMCANINCLK